MIALDTNLLVYAFFPEQAESQAARLVLDRAAENSRGWGIAYPCVTEFWSLVTKQGSPNRAAAFLTELRRAGAKVFYPKDGAQEELCYLAHDLKVVRQGIFDLQIAWISREAGATEIWTHDQGFIKLPGLKVVDPL